MYTSRYIQYIHTFQRVKESRKFDALYILVASSTNKQLEKIIKGLGNFLSGKWTVQAKL